ncbi:MAG: SpoIVB peptidase, partial [Turicibacter sp.]
MIQKLNQKRSSARHILMFVFSLLSLTGGAYTFSVQANNEQLLHIDEKNKLYEVSNKEESNSIHVSKDHTPYYVIPGGDAIGIKIKTEGLVVVDTYLVNTDNGAINPAKDAGIIKGDIIIAVNNQKISTIEDYKEQLSLFQNDNQIMISISRQGKVTHVAVKPVVSTDGVTTTGLYLRDKLAGIGTLTFIDPNSAKYGALGHEIIDQDTNQLVTISDGEIIGSNVLSIRRAVSGKPGEKVADINFDQKLGTLVKNNYFGIYGSINDKSMLNKELMPIAYMDEVKPGPAQIMTVLKGNKIESFDINITEVMIQNKKDVKGIKYIVTDQRLLDETGGIVQGMSGSPIIQNGKIVGAVTHVLV